MPNRIKKAVIPVAGLGTRMLPATKAIPKEMLPIVDKPLIQYIVNECIAAGIKEIVLVTHSSKNAIENHFDKLRFEIKTDLLTSSEVKTKNDGLVMSRNSSLQVVAINLGLIDGITTGTRFSVLLGKREEAVLRVIEVSRSLSLAEIEKGQFKSVPIGTKVVRKEQQTKSKNVGIWKQQQ